MNDDDFCQHGHFDRDEFEPWSVGRPLKDWIRIKYDVEHYLASNHMHYIDTEQLQNSFHSHGIDAALQFALGISLKQFHRDTNLLYWFLNYLKGDNVCVGRLDVLASNVQ